MFHEINGQWGESLTLTMIERVWFEVTLKIGECAGNENSKRKLERPIDKIVLLLESDNDNEFQ